MKIIATPLVLLSLVTTVKPVFNKCGNKLLEDCFCGEQFVDHATRFVVNCTNKGFTHTDMLMALPEETDMLIFTGNQLTLLPSNIFGDSSYLSRLKIIDFSNNSIREIKGKTFHHVQNVERLILNNNNISIAEEDDKNFHHPRVFSNFENLQELHLTDAFADNTGSALADDLHDIFVNSNLTKLYKLHLEWNEIRYFKDAKVFCDLPNLHDLYLGCNNIPILNFDVLCLKKLRYLDLELNNITKFYQKDLDMFDSLAELPNRTDEFQVFVNGNPFKCDANAKNFYTWATKTKVNVRELDKLKCIQSKQGNKYFINVQTLIELKQARISNALTVLLVILALILLTLVTTYVYIKHKGVRSRLSPLFESISRKVQYTKIESRVDV